MVTTTYLNQRFAIMYPFSWIVLHNVSLWYLYFAFSLMTDLWMNKPTKRIPSHFCASQSIGRKNRLTSLCKGFEKHITNELIRLDYVHWTYAVFVVERLMSVMLSRIHLLNLPHDREPVVDISMWRIFREKKNMFAWHVHMKWLLLTTGFDINISYMTENCRRC